MCVCMYVCMYVYIYTLTQTNTHACESINKASLSISDFRHKNSAIHIYNYIYVCLYIDMCVCVCMYIFTHLHIPTHTHTHACESINKASLSISDFRHKNSVIHICIYISIYVCINICVCMYVFMFVCMYVCMCVYIYTLTHTNTHAYESINKASLSISNFLVSTRRSTVLILPFQLGFPGFSQAFNLTFFRFRSGRQIRQPRGVPCGLRHRHLAFMPRVHPCLWRHVQQDLEGSQVEISKIPFTSINDDKPK